MLLRHVRWTAARLAAVVAVCFAPSSAHADTQILVEEFATAPFPPFAVVYSSQVFPSSTNVTTFAPPLVNFSNVTITVNTGYGAVSSLTTTVNATPIPSSFPPPSFPPTVGGPGLPQLRIIVTSDGFSTPNGGGSAGIQNNVAASSAISGGQNMLTSSTQLLNTPLFPGFETNSMSLAAGTILGLPTPPATDTRPSQLISPVTFSSIPTGFPNTFAIQQVSNVQVTNVDPSGIQSGSTVGGSASSLVITSPAPVPAPGGLALALIAVPVLTLRRKLGKRVAC